MPPQQRCGRAVASEHQVVGPCQGTLADSARRAGVILHDQVQACMEKEVRSQRLRRRLSQPAASLRAKITLREACQRKTAAILGLQPAKRIQD